MENLVLKRTNSHDIDFKALVKLLDEYLAEIDGILTLTYGPLNKLDYMETAIVAYHNNLPVGCGCFKQFDADTVEMKRMFVVSAERGKGIAGAILNELEIWAKKIGFTNSVLETGRKQLAAIAVYKRAGYQYIDNYGPYIGMENSVCMKKTL